jgi:hypothetical protein
MTGFNSLGVVYNETAEHWSALPPLTTFPPVKEVGAMAIAILSQGNPEGQHQRFKTWTLEQARFEFEARDCTLLAKEYQDNHVPMPYIHQPCGYAGTISLNNLLHGTLCRGCGQLRGRKKQLNTLEEVRRISKSYGFQFVSEEYLGNKPKHEFRCEKGHVILKRFNDVVSGYGCGECWREKLLSVGPGHPAFRHGLSEKHRAEKRFRPEDKQWTRSVLERDNFTCHICKQVGWSLEAHHLNAFAQVESDRTRLGNGITLCKQCHKEFHSNYGLKVNAFQFYQWAESKGVYRIKTRSTSTKRSEK